MVMNVPGECGPWLCLTNPGLGVVAPMDQAAYSHNGNDTIEICENQVKTFEDKMLLGTLCPPSFTLS